MSLEQWERKVLDTPGAPERVGEIEDEPRLAAGLTALREQAGVSQRELADRIGVSHLQRGRSTGARNAHRISQHCGGGQATRRTTRNIVPGQGQLDGR
jgi:hypothetical protein